MEKTAILAITAALAAAAVVIGTVASPAFAGSRFTIIQKKRPRLSLADFWFGSQSANNCVAVENTGGNACRIG